MSSKSMECIRLLSHYGFIFSQFEYKKLSTRRTFSFGREIKNFHFRSMKKWLPLLMKHEIIWKNIEERECVANIWYEKGGKLYDIFLYEWVVSHTCKWYFRIYLKLFDTALGIHVKFFVLYTWKDLWPNFVWSQEWSNIYFSG